MEASGANYADIIFFAIVAGFLALKLYSVLGKTDDTSEGQAGNAENKSTGNTMIDDFLAKEKEPVQEIVIKEESIDDFNFSDDKFKDVIQQIKLKDKSFTIESFLQGSSYAFEMLVNSFTAKDKDTLKNLLSAPLYKKIATQIDDLEAKGHSATKTVIAVEDEEITNAELVNNKAKIRVKFITEQISFIKDEKGEVIEGDTSYIEKVEDEWQLERNVNSQNPNWKITALS